MIQVAGFFSSTAKVWWQSFFCSNLVQNSCKIMFKKIMPQKWKQAHPRNITLQKPPVSRMPVCHQDNCTFRPARGTLFFALSFLLLLGGGASQYTIVILSALVYTSPEKPEQKKTIAHPQCEKNNGEDVATLQGVPYHFPKYSHILPNTSHI